MIMDLTVTPTSNVNYSEKLLMDPNFISHFYFEPNQEIIIFNKVDNKEEIIKTVNISMWDNKLIMNGVHYEVLRIFSK